jgi:hypothetical protein
MQGTHRRHQNDGVTGGVTANLGGPGCGVDNFHERSSIAKTRLWLATANAALQSYFSGS